MLKVAKNASQNEKGEKKVCKLYFSETFLFGFRHCRGGVQPQKTQKNPNPKWDFKLILGFLGFFGFFGFF